VRVIHQPNGGLSAARNAGIDWAFANSDSEWFYFADSDDWIHPLSLEVLYSAAEQTGCSVIIGGHQPTTGESPAVDTAHLQPTVWNPEEFFCKDNVTAIVVSGKLYRKECFREIRYPVGKIHEDEFITYKILFAFEHIAVIAQPLYAYYQNPDVECGNEDLLPMYYDMIESITSLDLSTNDDWKEACSIIDINSFIDYYATMVYISRSGDWPQGNYALWRTISSAEGMYSDCRWRWLMYDCNSLAMEESVLFYDSIGYLTEQDELFSAFWESPPFREQFQERLTTIAENCFNPDEMSQFIDAYDLSMRDILEKSWTRFHGKSNDKMDIYEAEMASFSAFFSGRKQVVESWFS